MTRVAFLIQAHNNPQQVMRLARCLLSAERDDSVYIHVDAKSDQDAFNSVCVGSNIFVDKAPITVNHSGFSQVRATLRLIQMAVRDQGYTHYMLLSGQCFPVKPIKELHRILSSGDFDYINYYPMPNLAKAKSLDRLEKYHFESWPLSILNGPIKRLPKRNFVKGLSTWPYAGSNWWTLQHETITETLSFLQRTPSFGKYMKTVVQCDEVFFQSILSMFGRSSCIKPALFWTEFNKLTKRPFVWTIKDLSTILEKTPFIVRKVDQNVNGDLIEALENIVFSK